MTQARLRRTALAWVLVLSAVAILLGSAVNSGSLRFSDRVLLLVAQAPASGILDRVMEVVSLFGSIEATGVMILLLVLLVRSETPLGWQRWVPLGVFVLITLTEIAAKHLVHQPLVPTEFVRVRHKVGVSMDTPFSFPSGHMTRITLVFGLVALRLLRRSGRLRWFWFCVAAVWIIGYSRVYLGEHWPADVAGGILLGGAGLSLCLALSPVGSIGDRLRWVRRTGPSGT